MTLKAHEIIKTEVDLGVPICKKIKTSIFPDIPWAECYRDVAGKFTLLKKVMHSMYTEKTRHEVLIELNRYSADELKDLIEG